MSASGFEMTETMDSLILNFHGVGPVLRPMNSGELNCWLDLDTFETILDLVRDHPHVGITVDDGNESDITRILPALMQRGLRARFFVCSGRIDQPTFLNRDQIHRLHAAGMGIGSHGVEHRSWRDFPPEQLLHQLESSRKTIEDKCGVAIDEAACPFGSYDKKVLAALRRTGYRRVYTSDGGLASATNWIVPRTTVTRTMALDEIRQLLATRPGLWQQFSTRTKSLCKRLR